MCGMTILLIGSETRCVRFSVLGYILIVLARKRALSLVSVSCNNYYSEALILRSDIEPYTQEFSISLAFFFAEASVFASIVLVVS